MIDIDKTIEGDAVLSAIKYCDLSKGIYCKTYNLAGPYLQLKAAGHNIEVQLLTDRVGTKTLFGIAEFLENKEVEVTVCDILKKIQPICGQIYVDSQMIEMSKGQREDSDAKDEQIRIGTEGSSDEIEVNTTAACDDRLKAEKEEVSGPAQRANDWWTQSIDDIEFTQEEFGKAKAKQATKPEEPCDLQCAVSFCKSIFEEKFGLYGASFCDMHPETVTDQLFMKATILKRRLTDRNKSLRLGFAFFEGVRDEFAAVVNYGVIALWRGGLGVQSLVSEAPLKFYTDQMQAALSLISEKGDDYGELWREQRIGTLADMIYTKVRRLKSIENQYRVGGMTEGDYKKFAGDQYKDLINYGLFGVVRMTEIIDYLQLEMEEDETEEEGYE